MYAIVEIGSKQYKVQENQEVFIDKVEGKEGDSLTFDQVLLTDNDGKISVGSPVVKGTKVSGKIVSPLVKGDKVIVFKKKRRKGFKRRNGHRQQFTKVLIEKIG